MIGAICNLGRYAREKEGISGSDIFVEKKQLTRKESILVLIKLKNKGGRIEFDGVSHKKYEDKKSEDRMLLYRQSLGRKAAYSPSVIFQDIQKTLIKKILPIFKEKYTFLSADDNNLLNNIADCIESNIDKISESIHNIVETVKNKETQALLTIVLNNKYPKDVDFIKKIFVYRCKKSWGNSYQNQVCSCCSDSKEVFGKAFPFTFFTVDKPGYAYGLNQKNTNKMLPICKECAVNLEIGKNYLFNHLNYSFYGKNYFLIPNFLREINESILKKIIDKKSPSTKIKDELKLAEDRILREINKNLEDSLTLTLFFYHSSKSSFDIIKTIENIFPSRFNIVFSNIDETNKIKILENLFLRLPSMKLSFGTFYKFFSNKKEHDDVFLEVISNILNSEKIDYIFLAKKCMNKIIDDYNNKRKFRLTTISALLLFLFLQKLNLLKNFYGGDTMNVEIKSEKIGKVGKIQKFLNQYKQFYNTDEKIVCFLLGVLVSEVLQVQNKNLGAEPFSKQLKGLQMSFRDIKALFTKTVDKLDQYKIKEYNNSLISEISQYFSKTESQWNLSNLDINFYILQGLSLAGKIIFDKTQEDEENE